ncbi:Mitochondrial import inner membrane translocase subunit TIM8 OS=Cryptococcus neoformans var, neoformans serotype D (strain B-3501A) GN=TIM8 PE=3 SV=1 [Rhizoctonia solani AG-1 IB]|uniref:Mitochondrial import inner membrane translocase subunit n=1 Tax=Thanatephorus cucumeris (strain AG1-IB / isolate 7/3/14) TaxID=1108050 RepID=A0A0B7FKL2_THACB|nr:Mitochondrial import inner membrane translocase subunit TIM8 OS=Cryptococcus neoformans var, neoformans serotype D (strain B-3501A) GN=TIM8 PE=3 SV=1 [Rhizoctonia solani AG-1 IB]
MDANQKFDEATQRELQAFIEQEQAKARVQATTHQLTDMCWTKCVTGSISTRFSSSEAYCLQNCEKHARGAVIEYNQLWRVRPYLKV